MKPQYSEIEFKNAKSNGKLPLICLTCNKIFHRIKKDIQRAIKHPKRDIKYCSKECTSHYRNKPVEVICKNCGVIFNKMKNQVKRSPNHFCSKSCAGTFNNKNKTYGYRRSKLEKWIEEQLTILYPSLEIHYNQKNAIKSELDIYIPSLNLAFELNGIFHYEPIYGINTLEKVQKNDFSKSKACHEAKIDLCIIDISSQKYFKSSTSQKFLDIIVNIINQRMRF